MQSVKQFNSSQVWLTTFVLLLGAVGCAYPDYTYVDDVNGSSGAGGTAGTGGTGTAGESGTGGTGASGATGGTAGAGGEAGDAGLDVHEDADADDVFVEADAEDVFVEADAEDVSVEADAQEAEADVIETGPEVTECPGVVEDCTNGIDDDCDGLVDCEDPDCQAGYTCFAPPPSGWEGYYAVYDGLTGGSVPTCTPDFPHSGPVLNRTPQGDPAQCSGCSCGSPTGSGCTEPLIWIGESTNCSGSGWTITVPESGTCYYLDMPETDGGTAIPGSVYFEPPEHDPLNPGSCSPSTVNVTKDDPSWGRTATSCQHAAIGGGCGSTLGCVAKPSSAFSQGLCIVRLGVFGGTCPSPYVTKRVYYSDFDDTRDCTDCACGTPFGVECGGVLQVGETSGCINPEVVLSSIGCSDAITPNTTQHMRKDTPPASGGLCSASGGQPMGSVDGDPVTAYTMCCWLPN